LDHIPLNRRGATIPDMRMESSSFVAVSGLIDVLSEYAVNFDCSERRMLFQQGDSPIGLFIVHSGDVALTMKDRAGNIVMRIPAQPGSRLGLPAVIGKLPYSLSAEASRGA